MLRFVRLSSCNQTWGKRIWHEGFVCIGWIVISPVRLRNWK